ncbi:cation channel sperm-associated protein 3 isoform X3 [Apteryx rowi]|uniref:cation channel sperm-associated protein 3 isoform X3 n=1 Tax=Apteryx rowi TaxID=308060 RepID=UPI000E1D1563|nr:cation channel sperm-associated protein 3 isoform X3 [Apteryx rowi]
MEHVEPSQRTLVASELLMKSLKSLSETDTRRSVFWQFRRKDTEFCAYLRRLLNSPVFTFLMICSISLNAILLAVETDYRLRLSSSTFFVLTDALILSIYTSEFLLKLYVDPIAYWKDGYNVLDAVILLIAFILYASSSGAALHFHSWEIAKGLQALRILKLIKYSNGMRIFTKALGQMVKTVMYVLILLFLLMFIFAILGHDLYGDPETGDTENWGNMEAAFFTLFSLVTVDGWTDLQQKLENHGFTNSHVFTIVFILLGFFVFFNMFIGVVIIKMQKTIQYKAFSELVDNFKKTLCHSDLIIVEDFCVSIPFIDLYLTALDLQDDTVDRLQDLYCEILGTLSMILQDMKGKSLPLPEKIQK